MLLDIQNLTVAVDGEDLSILCDANLKIRQGEVAALVGGSGSGKTTLGLAVLKLLGPGLKVASGKMYWKGRDLLSCCEKEMRNIRGSDIAMIFQEPLNAFNPLFSIEEQVDEVLRVHTRLNSKQRHEKIIALLLQAGIADPLRIMQSYPHQLSGGLRQRAMVAQALSCQPSLIIADEPTSSIDVTLQAQVIEMFARLREEMRLSFLFITHDFGIVRHFADRVYVMHQGRIIESGTVDQVLDDPRQEYTKELMRATL